MFYTELDDIKSKRTRKRTARNLLEIKRLCDDGFGFPPDEDYIPAIPARTLNDTLLIGSWNLRAFDSLSFGLRPTEAMLYISEIIGRFDIVAIQEVKQDLEVLERLRKLLGRYHWQYIVTDECEGREGNSERLAFIFDTRKVRFTGLSGEIPKTKIDVPFARTPFLVGFQCGWFKFAICTTHIRFGESTTVSRKDEIEALATHLHEKMEEYRSKVKKGLLSQSEYENIVLLGDLNIDSVTDESYRVLTQSHFDVPESLFDLKTNLGREKKVFDQIALIQNARDVQATGHGGVFRWDQVVYRPDDLKAYKSQVAKYYDSQKRKNQKRFSDLTDAHKIKYYRVYWRTHQVSDHYPIWIELQTNFGAKYLQRRAFPGTPGLDQITQ